VSRLEGFSDTAFGADFVYFAAAIPKFVAGMLRGRRLRELSRVRA
jgi:hypothetical protein